jgi:hypothetical protein
MRWSVWIQSTRWNHQPPVDTIRQTFESMGFRLREQLFDYYNPTAVSRFIAEHASPGAVTLWQLAWNDHWPNTRVVIQVHLDDQLFAELS